MTNRKRTNGGLPVQCVQLTSVTSQHCSISFLVTNKHQTLIRPPPTPSIDGICDLVCDINERGWELVYWSITKKYQTSYVGFPRPRMSRSDLCTIVFTIFCQYETISDVAGLHIWFGGVMQDTASRGCPVLQFTSSRSVDSDSSTG